VTNTIDPLGGAYFVEALTDKMEAAAYEYFKKIDELGGMVEAIKQNYPQREIADASFQYQCEVDDGKRIVVGVNRYQNLGDAELDTLRIDPALEQKQIDRLQGVRARRDSSSVDASLTALKQAASGGQNLMEPLLECARAHASEGEIIESLQTVFGTYTETPVF
jgi:methylmalonyl-CoA mutase N-terminal domain/subunit